MISRVGWIGLCIGLFLLQSSVIPLLCNGRWQPDVWLCTIIISVLAFDRKTAFAFAAVGGILNDIVTGNFFGLHVFPYLVTAFFTMAVIRERYNRKWVVSILTVIPGTVVYLFSVWIVVSMSGETLPVLLYLFYNGWGQVLANAAAAAVMHPLLWSMRREWEPKW